MRRALRLAALGSTHVAPNPLVGCVVVCDDQIIGEGYHQKYGDHHAEVNAINNVKQPELLKNSTLYVTLEPCSHIGKTPPCVDLILKNKIPKVVCAMYDPNPLVAGEGIKKLQNAGVEVVMEVLAHEAEMLNSAFSTFHKLKRPYILLKWARTEDGFMGRLPSDSQLSRKISGNATDIFVHKLRAESNGILIGSKTAISDNPTLTTRLWPGKNPLRIVFDSDGSINSAAHLFTDGIPTVVFGNGRELGREVRFVEPNSTTSVINQMLDYCYQNGINQVLVEGGLNTLQRFIDANIWDEAFEIVSPIFWNDGVKAPTLNQVHSTFKLGTDSIYHYKQKKR